MKFSSDISLWWLIPIGAIAFGLAYWLYAQKNNGWVTDLPKKWRYLLLSLRTFSILLLCLLLLGIIFQAFNYRKEKPILIIGIDDSSSMLNYSDSSSVKKTVESLIAKAKEELGNRFEVLPYSYSDIPEQLEQVHFAKNSTDISAALDGTKNDFHTRNLAGVLLVSDGNYNKGNNPIYTADKFNTSSIYTLGVGDTITKRDHFIKHVTHNDVAFLKNDFPIVVDIEGNKMGKTSTEVWIENNGKKIASQTIQYKDGVSDFDQVQFTLNATTPGYQKYTIHLTHKEREYNYDNNSRTVYIEVIDSRSKVLILSSAPHPDIAALKAVWDKDQNLEVKFELLQDWKQDLKNVDLIVWHEPGLNATRPVIQSVLNNSISKLFIVGSQSNASSIYQMNLGIEIPSTRNLDDVEGSLNTGFTAFETSEQLQKALQYYPPLKAKFGYFQAPKDAQILINQRIGPVVKKDPLLFFGNGRSDSGKNYKYGFVFGEGLWKWRLTEYARTQSFAAFDELISKTGQYLMVKQNTEPFRVTLPSTFLPTETISINATVLNASLDPITTSEVNFVLLDENGKESKLQFGAVGTNYKLDLGKLPAGKYTWKAFTSINGKYHEKKGEFIVKELVIEQADSKANHLVLQHLAQKTGGTFHLLKNYDAAIKEIKNREDFSSASYQEASFNELIEYFILFLLLTLSLFAEWFLRRYFGSY